MNKKEIMKYYVEEWIPHIDNYLWHHPKKGKIINYNNSKILLKLDSSAAHWSLALKPKSKNNILTNDFNLLVWIMAENYSNVNLKSPISEDICHIDKIYFNNLFLLLKYSIFLLF